MLLEKAMVTQPHHYSLLHLLEPINHLRMWNGWKIEEVGRDWCLRGRSKAYGELGLMESTPIS